MKVFYLPATTSCQASDRSLQKLFVAATSSWLWFWFRRESLHRTFGLFTTLPLGNIQISLPLGVEDSKLRQTVVSNHFCWLENSLLHLYQYRSEVVTGSAATRPRLDVHLQSLFRWGVIHRQYGGLLNAWDDSPESYGFCYERSFAPSRAIVISPRWPHQKRHQGFRWSARAR